MKRGRYTNEKPRIEKKINTAAMNILISLMPRQYRREAWSRGEGMIYSNCVWYQTWEVVTVDYWGEADSREAFDILHDQLITETTDWDGIGYAYDAENSTGEEIDKEQFYSPWRLSNKVGRAEIIQHCRQLVKEGVKWEDAA
ncbi:hypothetical protein [Klebsiella pneumoniae]|uniref:hypothetical protein n=1 Tax=Klebsiella pneumoniae TaxID=573 RepID=UPI001B8D3604|nr:hypothetical protein [Klebsiella pneumoniae]MBR7305549.1 hypothetical protein [Klebsiella pneumoniae]MBR7346876.1 hypothetical protein [Klebsiella pneumoniae]MDM9222124.1 hypothetical protein [Klebsiella pneumoniae]HBQ2248249.1 hypothetical protein [Klebsiella pneumoniae]HEI9862436.1 hypothetical protein [Klebsiella pneumoniae]